MHKDYCLCARGAKKHHLHVWLPAVQACSHIQVPGWVLPVRMVPTLPLEHVESWWLWASSELNHIKRSGFHSHLKTDKAWESRLFFSNHLRLSTNPCLHFWQLRPNNHFSSVSLTGSQCWSTSHTSTSFLPVPVRFLSHSVPCFFLPFSPSASFPCCTDLTYSSHYREKTDFAHVSSG